MAHQTTHSPPAQPTTQARDPHRRRRPSTYFWFVLPAVVLFAFFHTGALINGFYQSLTDNTGFGQANFIGFENYVKAFSDPKILSAYGFTFFFAIVSTVALNVVAFFLALVLNEKIAWRLGFRALFFIPNVLPMLVIAYVFSFIFSKLVPQVLEGLGGSGVNILGDPDLAWIGLVIVTVWRAAAFSTIIYIAGLQTIDPDVYEAAALDGAGWWRRAAHITFPLVFSFFVINVVLSFKDFLQAFDQVVGLTSGGPGTATQTVSLIIFRSGFSGGQYAYQMANAFIYFVVIVVVSVLQFKILGRRQEGGR